ncbi:hypothetical protein D9758_009702 [Tetrapyrgos nigripes]|uniref:Uncharacterized protein n=1 Tax=Tetrapyrgos nigripes TaxID=182062 RepID=A0A8H5CR93_9AGAR|nr:hypothetical protein D9758_009702 [Tetrapyrgos nigripes]
MTILPEPWRGKDFNLDSSGVAGFFGGEEAISAMTTVHLYRGRKWLGWYNSPGGYTVAKCYGRLAKGSLWTGLYPGSKLDPVELFGLGGKNSPKFVAAHSGTILQETSHLAYLLLKMCEGLEAEKGDAGKRLTTPSGVTVVHLEEPKELHSSDPADTVPPILRPAIPRASVLLTSLIPIGFTFAACVLSALVRDWYAFSMILLGAVANGFTCLVLGSGTLTVKRVKPAPDVPKGDGLLETKKELVILLGPESAVAQVTRGSFGLEFPSISAPNYHDVGICCVLLTSQFLVQLLLIPQAGLFGQTMFLVSFAVSWLYNAYLSSFDKEEMQREVLFTKKVLNISGEPSRYMFGTRTSLAVFVTFALQPKDPLNMLNHLIPNDTEIWNAFKKGIAKQIDFQGEDLLLDLDRFKSGGDVSLVGHMRGDAQHAYNTYRKYLTCREEETASLRMQKQKQEV